MTPRCVYCERTADAREHWIPRGLGNFRGYSPLVERICERCNQSLGRELDEEFLRTGPTAVERAFLGIKGRKDHTSVSPFDFRATSAAPPTRLTIPDSTGDSIIEGEIEPGSRVVRARRQLIVQHGGKQHLVPFPASWTSTQLTRALDQRGLSGCELLKVYCGQGEEPESTEIREVLTGVFGQFSVAALSWDGEPHRQLAKVELVAGISTAYIRALAKFGFHYALWASPSITGHEGSLRATKDFIRWGAGEWPRFVELNGPNLIPQLEEGMAPKLAHHFLSTQTNEIGLVTLTQFFVSVEHVMPPVLVRLAPSFATSLDTGHVVRYFAKPDDGFDGEIVTAPRKS